MMVKLSQNVGVWLQVTSRPIQMIVKNQRSVKSLILETIGIRF